MRWLAPRPFLGRRNQTLTLYLLTALLLVIATRLWWFSGANDALKASEQDFHHLRRNRNLKHYVDNTELLIQPSSSPCEGPQEVPLIILVASAPSHSEQRAAIRHSWAKHLPTFFVLGLDGADRDEQLVNCYIEAKEYGDMIVFDFKEHRQNLTLKAALMLHWTLRRCPLDGALLKTDDDVLVNPWALKDVLKMHQNDKLIGYKINDTAVDREEYSKRFMPRWLYPRDVIPEYLSGSSYIIQGDYISRILKKAYKTPMVNLEDVFFTHIVANNALVFKLTHERRLSPFKPWIRSSCAYWDLAVSHSLSAKQITKAWVGIERLAKKYEYGDDVCGFWRFLSNDLMLH